MKTGVPIVVLSIPVMAFWLTRRLGEVGNINLPNAGHWTLAEKRISQLIRTKSVSSVSFHYVINLNPN